jgi:pyruvate,water dikinase
MVPAFISGVLFTINPITSQKEEMVINATWGLGEALVSGLVEADEIIASRENGKIKECRIGQKQQTISLISGQSGTVVENTGDQAQKMCLTEAQVENLVKVAKKIEDKKGVPQDIEWCIARDTLYILQARPVTSLKTEKTGEGERFWTADNAQEAFPGVVSPLTTSFIKILLDDAFYASKQGLPRNGRNFAGSSMAMSISMSPLCKK